jgi:predicted nucleic acid-binding protein
VANFTAVYDACVLYPAPLRDFLMQLAVTDLFRARWSEEIHNEWIRNLLVNRPDLSLEQLTKTKDLMNSHVRDALVANYESLIPSLTLPDPNDRHVLAAAIRGHADIIVTFNLKDFPKKTLALYDIAPQHPDEFILDLLDLQPIEVCRAAERVRQRLRHPPIDAEAYLGTLLRQGLPKTVSLMRELGFAEGFGVSVIR